MYGSTSSTSTNSTCNYYNQVVNSDESLVQSESSTPKFTFTLPRNSIDYEVQNNYFINKKDGL